MDEEKHLPEEAITMPAMPRLMGRYVVQSELGRGRMGVVYRCYDEVSGVYVALKSLTPELSQDPREIQEFCDNFQLAQNLNHPNIANVKQLECDPETGTYYLVMEYVKGESLRSWIRRRARMEELTPEVVLPILEQIADALDYAHARKIIHRDIKPGNVMLDTHGTAKLLDFGLAAKMPANLTYVTTDVKSVAGTGPYMSPEQWQGERQGVLTDQYALGVLAYEMLAGHLPFESIDNAVLKQAVLEETPDPIPGLPRVMQAALLRAMAKHPEERFASCMEFIQAINGKKVKPAPKVTKAPPLPPPESPDPAKEEIAPEAPSAVVRHARIAEPADEESPQANVSATQTSPQRAWGLIFLTCCLMVVLVVGIVAGGSYLMSLHAELRTLKEGQAETQRAVEAQRLAEAEAAQRQLEAEQRRAEEQRRAAEEQQREAEEAARRAAEAKQQALAKTQAILQALGLVDVNPEALSAEQQGLVELYQKAEQGDAEAQFTLGVKAELGRGIAVSEATAVKWYTAAANGGNANAQWFLGRLYAKGKGVEQSNKTAFLWYQKAAEQNQRNAQYLLGVMYEKGEGVEASKETALMWYQKAAESGQKMAIQRLQEWK